MGRGRATDTLLAGVVKTKEDGDCLRHAQLVLSSFVRRPVCLFSSCQLTLACDALYINVKEDPRPLFCFILFVLDAAAVSSSLPLSLIVVFFGASCGLARGLLLGRSPDQYPVFSLASSFFRFFTFLSFLPLCLSFQSSLNCQDMHCLHKLNAHFLDRA